MSGSDRTWELTGSDWRAWDYKVDISYAHGTLDKLLAIYRHRGTGPDVEVEVWDGQTWVEQPAGAEVLHIYRIPYRLVAELREAL